MPKSWRGSVVWRVSRWCPERSTCVCRDRSCEAREWRYVTAAEVSPDWEARTGQSGYHLANVVIAERYRGLAFQADEPAGPGYPPDQIELFSEVHLRDTLGLVDGDRIAVSLS